MYTAIGQIINTHGIQGALKIYPYTPDNNRFFELENVYLGEDKKLCHVNKVSLLNQFVVIHLKEVNSLEVAKKMKNVWLYVLDEDRIELKAGTYFIDEIIGLDVYNQENTYIGQVDSVYEGLAHDVYYVRNHENKKQVYAIPAVKEFILDVNISENYMKVNVIEGMIL